MPVMSDAQTTPAGAVGGIPRFERRHRLGLALEHAELSVQAMADHLGVNRNTVGNYLSDRTRPSTAVLRTWALRCGVPFEWLRDGIGGDNDPGDQGFSQRGCNGAVVLPFRPTASAPAHRDQVA